MDKFPWNISITTRALLNSLCRVKRHIERLDESPLIGRNQDGAVGVDPENGGDEGRLGLALQPVVEGIK